MLLISFGGQVCTEGLGITLNGSVCKHYIASCQVCFRCNLLLNNKLPMTSIEHVHA